MKRITTIEMTRRETLVIQAPTEQDAPRCPYCHDGHPMLRPETAAALTGLSQRVIFRAVDAGWVPFTEETGGRFYVCAVALFAALSGASEHTIPPQSNQAPQTLTLPNPTKEML